MGRGGRDSRLTRVMASVHGSDPLVELTPLGPVLARWYADAGEPLDGLDGTRRYHLSTYAYRHDGVEGVTRSDPFGVLAFHEPSGQLAAADSERVYVVARTDPRTYARARELLCSADEGPGRSVSDVIAGLGLPVLVSFRCEHDLLLAPLASEEVPPAARLAAPPPAEPADRPPSSAGPAPRPAVREELAAADAPIVRQTANDRFTPAERRAFERKPVVASGRERVQYDDVPQDAPFPQLRIWTLPPFTLTEEKRIGYDRGRLSAEGVLRMVEERTRRVIALVDHARADRTLAPGSAIMTSEAFTTGLVNSWNAAVPAREGGTVADRSFASFERIHRAVAELSAERRITVYLGTALPVEDEPQIVRDPWGGLIHRAYNTFLIFEGGERTRQDKWGLYWGTKQDLTGERTRRDGSVEKTVQNFSDFEIFAAGATGGLLTRPYGDGVGVFLNCHEFKVARYRSRREITDKFAFMRGVWMTKGNATGLRELERAERQMLDAWERFQDPVFVRSIRAVYHNSNYTNPEGYFQDWCAISKRVGELVPDHPGFWLYATNLGMGLANRFSGIYFVRPPEPVIGFTPTKAGGGDLPAERVFQRAASADRAA